jgi:hypothetical protein
MKYLRLQSLRGFFYADGQNTEVGNKTFSPSEQESLKRELTLNNAKARDARTPYSKGVNPRVIALREMVGT